MSSDDPHQPKSKPTGPSEEKKAELARALFGAPAPGPPSAPVKKQGFGSDHLKAVLKSADPACLLKVGPRDRVGDITTLDLSYDPDFKGAPRSLVVRGDGSLFWVAGQDNVLIGLMPGQSPFSAQLAGETRITKLLLDAQERLFSVGEKGFRTIEPPKAGLDYLTAPGFLFTERSPGRTGSKRTNATNSTW
jgi:hypothetical protein